MNFWIRLILVSGWIVGVTDDSCASHRIDLEERKRESLATIPQELFQKIVDDLSLQDLSRLGQISHCFQNKTQDNQLWIPVYRTHQKQLFPLLKSEILFNILPRDLIASYKAALGLLTVLQRFFVDDQPPVYSVIKTLTQQTFCKNCPYREVILYQLACLYQDVPNQQYHGRKLFYSRPDIAQYLQEGTGPFQSWPCQYRLEILQGLARKGDLKAQDYAWSALVLGTLDQRPAIDRWFDIYQQAMSGYSPAFKTVIDHLTLGNFSGMPCYSYEESLVRLEELAGKFPASEFPHALANFLYRPSVPTVSLSETARFKRLQTLAQQGNLQAHSYRINCLYDGSLGVDLWPENERFTALWNLWQDPSTPKDILGVYVATIIATGQLGQHRLSAGHRLEVLQEMAFIDIYKGVVGGAGDAFVNFICEDPLLDLEQESVAHRLDRLKDLAQKGSKAAQRCLVQAMVTGSLNSYSKDAYHQVRLSEEQRLQQLKEYCRHQYDTALDVYSEVLYRGQLGEDRRCADDRYLLLEQQAAHTVKAQQYLELVKERGGFIKRLGLLNRGLINKKILFSSLSVEDLLKRNVESEMGDFLEDEVESDYDHPLSAALRRKILEKRADQGHLIDQEWIYYTLSLGKAPYHNYLPRHRFTLLAARANQGERRAIRWLVTALASGGLDQDKIPLLERFDQLKAWALTGDATAQNKLMEMTNRLSPHRSAQEQYALLADLMSQGISRAGERLCQGLVNGFPSHFSKAERLHRLIDLSAQGYESAQQILTDLILPFYQETPWFEHSLQSEDLGFEEERIAHLMDQGDAGNRFARQRLFDSVALYSSKKPPQHETILLTLFKWYGQGELTFKMYNHQESAVPRRWSRLISSKQIWYPLFELLVDASSDRLKAFMKQTLLNIEHNKEY